MRFHHLAPGHGVLELDHGSPFSTSIEAAKPEVLDLELLVWWGGGEPTRAAWVLSQSGRLATWAVVGVA